METPAFMPVGTQGTVKGDAAQGFERDGLPDFARQYLSSLSPPGRGADSRIGRAASLHELGWTDFNGQRRLPSLQPRQRCESYRRRGFAFNLIWMALIILLTPENVVQIQEALGSDIAMVLDECIPHDANREYARDSTARTIRWAERCLQARSQGRSIDVRDYSRRYV